jgi:hypothetical protein
MKAKYTKDHELTRAEIDRHKGEVDEAREQYAQIVYEGISNETCISVAIDAMDQFKPRLPVTATHSAGGIMHKLQLKLTGVIVHGNEKPRSIYICYIPLNQNRREYHMHNFCRHVLQRSLQSQTRCFDPS